MNRRDAEILFHRSAQFTCGVFGHLDDEDEDAGTVRPGGTGVLIGPCHAITAKHVLHDLFATNPDRADYLRRLDKSRQVTLPHRVCLAQIGETLEGEAVVWGVTRQWDAPLTDVCLVEMAPNTDAATQRLSERLTFPDWQLLPPERGEQVELVGMPPNSITASRGRWRFSFPHVLQQAVVSDVCEVRHSQGFLSFPGFFVNHEVEHGFSGGPVFLNGRLCGVVTACVDGRTYVASLWPLLLMQFRYPDLGELSRDDTLERWFEIGLLRSPDWPALKGRCRFGVDEHEKPYAYLRSSSTDSH